MKRILVSILLLTLICGSAQAEDVMHHFQNDTDLLERITDESGLIVFAELAPGESIDLDVTIGPFKEVYVHTQAGG